MRAKRLLRRDVTASDRQGKKIAKYIQKNDPELVTAAKQVTEQHEVEALIDDSVTDLVTEAAPDDLDDPDFRDDPEANEVWFAWYYRTKNVVYRELGLPQPYGDLGV